MVFCCGEGCAWRHAATAAAAGLALAPGPKAAIAELAPVPGPAAPASVLAGGLAAGLALFYTGSRRDVKPRSSTFL